MYSPRRRYHKYYSKKYYRNNLFAPSMKKAPAPNYYQMKGRILQQTPRKIQNNATRVVSRKYLDELYKTLQDYKYPLPKPIDLKDYIFYYLTDPLTLDQLPVPAEIGAAYFDALVNVIPKPEAPEGYHYSYEVMEILFKVTAPISDNSQFNFTWHTPLLQSGSADIITKSLSSTITGVQSGVVNCIPSIPNQCLLSRVQFNSAGINVVYLTRESNDETVSDDGYYPFVAGDPQSESNLAYISYNLTSTSANIDKYSIQYRLLMYLAVDQN